MLQKKDAIPHLSIPYRYKKNSAIVEVTDIASLDADRAGQSLDTDRAGRKGASLCHSLRGSERTLDIHSYSYPHCSPHGAQNKVLKRVFLDSDTSEEERNRPHGLLTDGQIWVTRGGKDTRNL